jgi:pimeloyl-ACP methyl ester carboxylesterase
MAGKHNSKPRFAVCVQNEGYEASLERHKLYVVLPDAEAEREGDVRVVDESGEDYLYPADWFVPLEKKKLMDASFDDIPSWNKDLENKLLDVKEYWEDYTRAAPSVTVPVLFFYGQSDWMVGPNHYKQVHFPTMLLWPSPVGHVPFLENLDDLARAIASYRKWFALRARLPRKRRARARAHAGTPRWTLGRVLVFPKASSRSGS